VHVSTSQACTANFNTAVNGAGEAVFTWTRDGSILTRVLSASGTLSATRTVAATPSVPANHLTAISPNGSINYTWLDTSFDSTLTHVLRTRQRSAAGAFGARKTVVTVDTGGNPQAPQFDVDAADGASTIVYTRPNGGAFDSPVTVATRVLSGTTLAPAATLSAPSASYPNASGPTVSIDAAGGVTLAWVRGSERSSVTPSSKSGRGRRRPGPQRDQVRRRQPQRFDRGLSPGPSRRCLDLRLLRVHL
jgi:hypothetical protein